MPAYTDSIGFNKGSVGFDANGVTHGTKMEVLIDLPKIVAARLAAGATALANGDSLDVLPIPAGALVVATGFQTLTLQASLTASLGDAASATRYLNASTAPQSVGWSALGGATPFLYTADGVLRLTLAGATPTTAVLRVWAYVVDAN
jgi:hypothetical protein